MRHQIVKEGGDWFIEEVTAFDVHARNGRCVPRVQTLAGLEGGGHSHHGTASWFAGTLGGALVQEPQDLTADLRGAATTLRRFVISLPNAHLSFSAVVEEVLLLPELQFRRPGSKPLRPLSNPHAALVERYD